MSSVFIQEEGMEEINRLIRKAVENLLDPGCHANECQKYATGRLQGLLEFRSYLVFKNNQARELSGK